MTSAKGNRPPPNGMAFARKVQIVTGATLGVLGLLAFGQAVMLKSILEPAIANAMASVARDSAVRDSALLVRINANSNVIAGMSRDRIVLMTILETPAGPARQAFIAALREQWSADAVRQDHE